MSDIAMEAPAVEAVESTAVETTTTAVETNAPPSETATPDHETDALDPETEGQKEETPVKGQPLVSRGVLRPDVKAALEKLKVENPSLAADLKRQIFQSAQLQAELPQGIKEVRELRETLKAHGGAEGIQAKAELAAAHEELDSHYLAGDPKFLDSITDTPEGKDAFMRVAPLAMDRFSQMNPDGFASYVSQVVLSHAIANNIPSDLQMLQYLTKSNPELSQFTAKIANYFSGLQELAKKPVSSVPQKNDAQPDDREQQLTQREQRIKVQEWERGRSQARTSIADSEMSRLTKGRTVSEADKATIQEFFEVKMKQLLKDNGQHSQMVQKYWQAGDQDGYSKLFKALYQDKIPLAMKYAVEKVLPGKPGPKIPPPAASQAAVGQPKPADGFQMVKQRPDLNEINHQSRTRDMVMKNQAILRDGRRVQWA